MPEADFHSLCCLEHSKSMVSVTQMRKGLKLVQIQTWECATGFKVSRCGEKQQVYQGVHRSVTSIGALIFFVLPYLFTFAKGLKQIGKRSAVIC